MPHPILFHFIYRPPGNDPRGLWSGRKSSHMCKAFRYPGSPKPLSSAILIPRSWFDARWCTIKPAVPVTDSRTPKEHFSPVFYYYRSVLVSQVEPASCGLSCLRGLTSKIPGLKISNLNRNKDYFIYLFFILFSTSPPGSLLKWYGTAARTRRSSRLLHHGDYSRLSASPRDPLFPKPSRSVNTHM